MKALVVYESMFGNTERVAQAIAAGISESMDVEAAAVATAPATVPPDVCLLIVGGPTHAFSMSRRNTREDAVRQWATASTRAGLREWLADLPPQPGAVAVTTFDTRVSGARRLPGSAAKSAARSARRRGFVRVECGESFYVERIAGPMLDGEVERATQWGRQIARTVSLRGRA